MPLDTISPAERFEQIEAIARESTARATELFLSWPSRDRYWVLQVAREHYHRSAFWDNLSKLHRRSP